MGDTRTRAAGSRRTLVVVLMTGVPPPFRRRLARASTRASGPRRPRALMPRMLAAATLTTVSLAACAGNRQRTGGHHANPSASAVSGASLFAANCSSCHTLTGPSGRVTQGGDLAGSRMSEALIISFTRIMPVRRPLNAAEVRAVARYVLAAQRRHASAAG